MKKRGESDAVSKVRHRHGKSVASLQCARTNKSIIYITMHKQKAPFTICPAPKRSKFSITDIRENQVNLVVLHGHRLKLLQYFC